MKLCVASRSFLSHVCPSDTYLLYGHLIVPRPRLVEIRNSRCYTQGLRFDFIALYSSTL